MCTFGILALELAVIRWIGGQVRSMALGLSAITLLAVVLYLGSLAAWAARRRARRHA